MGLRFRKSLKLGPININLSKSGIGTSIGAKGFRIGKNSKGKVYRSFNIPGTGISYLDYRQGKIKGKIVLPKTESHHTNELDKKDWIYGRIDPQSMWLPQKYAVKQGFSLFTIKSENERNKILEKAQKLLIEENYEEALELAKPLEKEFSNDAVVLYNIGLCLYNCEKYEEAIPYLSKRFLEYKDDFKTQYLLAECNFYLDTEEGYEKALEYYEKVIAKETDFDDVLIDIARCYYELNDFEQSIKLLQTVSEDSDQYIISLNYLAHNFVASDDLDLALETLKRAPLQKRNLDDDLMEIHYTLGDVYYLLGDYKNALKHFKKIYAQDVSFEDVSERIDELENKE